MAGVAGQAARHFLRRNGADLALRVDGVRADEELVRLAVDHAVGRRAADAFGPDDLPEVRRDFIELVRRAERQVRPVTDNPQPVCPRYDRSRAALTLLVECGEMRIDAGDLNRFEPPRSGELRVAAGRSSLFAANLS